MNSTPAKTKPKLLIAPCSHEAAKYAVLNWHYSRKMPCGKQIKYGVWEDDDYVGAVMFGRGATPNVAKSLGVRQDQMAELVRVAMRPHVTPTSRVVAICCKQIKRDNPGLRVLVSFADWTNQGHVGTIYQAGGWLYTGVSKAKYKLVDGVESHGRSVVFRNVRKQKPNAVFGYSKEYEKHRYLKPLDTAMMAVWRDRMLPYPKRPTGELVSQGTSSAK